MLTTLACIALLGQDAAPKEVAVEKLLADGAKYDGKAVVAKGQVAEYQEKTSKKGNAYTVFKLVSGKSVASVYSRGRVSPPPKNGALVRVTGVFEVERKVGTFTVKNQIDASPVKGTPFGVTVLDRPSG